MRHTLLLLETLLLVSLLPVWIPLIRRKSEAYSFYRYALVSTAIAQVATAFWLFYASTSFSAGMIMRLFLLAAAGLAWTSAASERRGIWCAISVTLWCGLFLFSCH